MTASLVKELYHSPNGDRWVLNRDVSGKLIVAHHPNITSGGQVSEIEVEAFLARGGHGPEHQALLEALARAETPNRAEGDQSSTGRDRGKDCTVSEAGITAGANQWPS